MTEHDNHLEDIAGVNDKSNTRQYVKIEISIGDNKLVREIQIEEENSHLTTAEIVGDKAQSMAESLLSKF